MWTSLPPMQCHEDSPLVATFDSSSPPQGLQTSYQSEYFHNCGSTSGHDVDVQGNHNCCKSKLLHPGRSICISLHPQEIWLLLQLKHQQGSKWDYDNFGRDT